MPLDIGLRNFANSLISGQFVNPKDGPTPVSNLHSFGQSKKGWWGNSTAHSTVPPLKDDHFIRTVNSDQAKCAIEGVFPNRLQADSLKRLRQGMNVEGCIKYDEALCRDLRKQAKERKMVDPAKYFNNNNNNAVVVVEEESDMEGVPQQVKVEVDYDYSMI